MWYTLNLTPIRKKGPPMSDNHRRLEGWTSLIQRSDRCDWSLFSLALALLEHFLNQVLPLPLAFVPLELLLFKVLFRTLFLYGNKYSILD